ncbi:MAG: response regulator [Myxococcales bacterium]|nr:response regulator [Myxococcales bacterium]
MLLKKLVIAEDDDAVAHLVAASLGDAGFLCLRARDGEEALNITRSELPDALVLDVMMPKLDGIEVCKRLKADVLISRVPILMLTSLAGVDDRIAGLDAGADDYLPKPFDLRELAARVKALIRQSRRERDRNPTTNLPGSEAIDDKVTTLLKGDAPFVLLYVDIENFRSYADVYGYRRADDVVSNTGKLILQEARSSADAPPFVGHIGGDDFIVICAPGQADPLSQGIGDAFGQTVDSYYDDADKERGYISIGDEADQEVRRVNFMTTSIARIDVEPSKFETTDELAEAMTRAKAMTRRKTHSGLFKLPRRPIE